MSDETEYFELYDVDESKRRTFSREEAEEAYRRHFRVVEYHIWRYHKVPGESVVTIVSQYWN